MNVSLAYQSYQQTNIETASPEKLLLLLYSGAIAKLERARGELERKDYGSAHTLLVKAQDIVLELMVSLDWDTSPDLCNKLHSLYDYVYRQLVEANVRKDCSKIEESLQILSELHSGWREIVLRQESPVATEVPNGRLNLQG